MRLIILAACLLFGAAQATHKPVVERDAAGSRYQSEWWQLSASLVDADGRSWGLEWALYLQNSNPRGAAGVPPADKMSLLHVAITTPDGQSHEQRFEHGGIVRAGAAPREIVIDDDRPADWEWVTQGEALFPARLSFSIGDRDLNLLLDSPAGPDGDAGRTASTASGHAASEPLIRVRGFVDRGASKTYLRGHGRFEREWRTPLLAGALADGD